MARIPSCCGCGVGQQLQLRWDPLAWEPPYTAGAALKKTKKKKKKKEKKKDSSYRIPWGSDFAVEVRSYFEVDE